MENSPGGPQGRPAKAQGIHPHSHSVAEDIQVVTAKPVVNPRVSRGRGQKPKYHKVYDGAGTVLSPPQMRTEGETQSASFSHRLKVRRQVSGRSRIAGSAAELFHPLGGPSARQSLTITTDVTCIRTLSPSTGRIVPCVCCAQLPGLFLLTEPSGLGTCSRTSHTKHRHRRPSTPSSRHQNASTETTHRPPRFAWTTTTH